MAGLRRTRLHSAASRQPVLPGIGLPLNVVLWLLGAIVFTMAVFRGWRSWLVLAILWLIIGVAARLRVARDHNAFRADKLTLQTKGLAWDADRWHGTTLKSFPPPRLSDRPRGIFR